MTSMNNTPRRRDYVTTVRVVSCRSCRDDSCRCRFVPCRYVTASHSAVRSNWRLGIPNRRATAATKLCRIAQRVICLSSSDGRCARHHRCPPLRASETGQPTSRTARRHSRQHQTLRARPRAIPSGRWDVRERTATIAAAARRAANCAPANRPFGSCSRSRCRETIDRQDRPTAQPRGTALMWVGEATTDTIFEGRWSPVRGHRNQRTDEGEG